MGDRPEEPDERARDAVLGRASPGLAVQPHSGAKRFGKYEVAASIGRGGMGEIYLARDDSGDSTELVALKVLVAGTEDDDLVRMFMDEAAIMARIESEHVLRIFDFGTEDGSYFLAMEYLSGRPLVRVMVDAYQRGRGLDYAFVAAVGAQAARGLADAHAAKTADGRPLAVIHRDVSPQNIFLTYDGFTKVIDFGVARASERLARTAVGHIKGKAAYMSPEQIEGRKDIDGRSDVFALGVCLWEMAAGRRLFKRDKDYDTMMAVTEGPLVPPTTVRRRPEPKLDTILMKALARDRDERTPSALALAEALEAYVKDSAGERRQRISTLMDELFHDDAEEERALIRNLKGGTATDIEVASLRELSGISQQPEVHTPQQITIVGRPADMAALDDFGDEDDEDAEATVMVPRAPRVRRDSIVPKLSTDQRSLAVERALEALKAQKARDDRRGLSPRDEPQGPSFEGLARWAMLVILLLGLASVGLVVWRSTGQSEIPEVAPPVVTTGKVTLLPAEPDPVEPAQTQRVLRELEANKVRVEIDQGKYRLHDPTSKRSVPVAWEVEFLRVENDVARGYLAVSKEPGAASAALVAEIRGEDWSVARLSINDCPASIELQPTGIEVAYAEQRLLVPFDGGERKTLVVEAPRFAERLELEPLGLAFGLEDAARPMPHCATGWTRNRVTLEGLLPGKYTLVWMGGGRTETQRVALPAGSKEKHVVRAKKSKRKKRRRRR